MKAAPARTIAAVVLGAFGVAGGLAWLVGASDQRERERQALRARVIEIERRVRAHDATLWLLVEGGFPPGEKHAAVEPAHESLRADLDRLAHLEGLRLLVQQVDVDADTASVDYLVEGRAVRSGGPAAPKAGRFSFHKTREEWVLSGNRFAGER